MIKKIGLIFLLCLVTVNVHARIIRATTASRDSLSADFNLGNNNATTTVFDTSGSGNDLTETGTVAFANTGVTFVAGSGNYISGTGTGIYNTVDCAFMIKFTPTFAPDVDVYHVMMDGTSGGRYGIQHGADGNSNVLYIVMGTATVETIPLATYSPFWKTNEKNVLIVSGTDGDTDVWLNGTAILTNDATSWTAADPANIYIGASNGGSVAFDGEIHSVRIWQRQLTNTEVTILSADRDIALSTASRDSLTLDLTMGNSNGTTTVFDTSGNGEDFTEEGTVTFVQGIDGYIETDNTSGQDIVNSSGNVYGSAILSWVIKFSPDFATDDNDTYVFTNSSGSRYFMSKLPNLNSNALRIQCADTVVHDVAEASYTSFWNVGEENVLIVTSDSAGDTDAYLNGSAIVTDDTTTWTPAAETAMTISGHASQGFDGKTYSFKVYNRILTDTEIATLSADRAIRGYTALNDNLAGFWSMDTVEVKGATLLDRSGNDNTATADGTPTAGQVGTIKEAIDFNSANPDFLTIVDDASLNLTTNFTFSTWIKKDGIGVLDALYDSGDNTNHWRINVLAGDNKLNFTEDGIADYAANTALVAGIWYHLGVVKNGDGASNLTFYLDGVADGTASVGSVATPTGQKLIGKVHSGGFYMNGLMDETRLYNVALTASQMLDLYEAGK